MKRRALGRNAKVAMAAAIVILVAMGAAGLASAKKKEKAVLPDYVSKAQTVAVLILPEAREAVNDPFANRKAQEEVEKAVMKWGRFRLTQEAFTADLVIGVRKGTGKIASPTIGGGPVDTRPGTIETTDNQIRVGAQQGRPPGDTQSGDASSANGRASPGMEVGAEADTLEVFQGGDRYSVNSSPVWRYSARNGLNPPEVTAVEQFRKAVEESEKAAAQKQQQSQQQGQKKNP